jgi:undecaprenyl-diphosphatase
LAVATGGLLADGAREHSDLSAGDPSVAAWFVRGRTPLLTGAAQVVTTVGSEAAIGILTVLALLWVLFVQRSVRSAVLLGACMGTAAVLTVGIKHVVARPRPPASMMLGPLETNGSFPSGHTLFSTVFFGTITGLLLVRTHRRLTRTLLVGAWAGASAAVGISRLYLGYHWLTDVLASWVLAVAILAIAAAAGTALARGATPAMSLRRSGLGVDHGPVAAEES